MKKLKLFTLIIILSFISCTKINDDGFEVYKIKKNRHRSVVRIQHTKKDSFNMRSGEE